MTSSTRAGSVGSKAIRSGALAALLGVVVLLVANAFSSEAATKRVVRPAIAGPSGFSHAVVVDEQRPGFEPDVKIDSKGVVYSSVPFGFSTTQSFVWSSRDNGNSYQFTPGTIGPGKPATCVGGGDTDLYLDAKDTLYFSDLQGLTNISNSKSTDGGAHYTTNCVGAPNTPDDRMWFTGTGSSSAGNLTLYQDYDAATGLPSGGNQLVETVSHDGTTFLPVVNTNVGGLTGDCLGGAVQNCVTDNEGISGNQVTDPATGNVYIAHTTIENSASGAEVGVRISEGKITPGTPTTATWSESPNLDGPLCPGTTKASDGSFTCVDSNGNPTELAGENFASIARDSAGYLYVTFTAGSLDHANSSDPNFGGLTGPEQIYVVHSLQPAPANPAQVTWSAPQAISGSGPSAGTNTFPWIVAGSGGRVAVAWYHTSELSQPGTCLGSGSGTCTLYGAASLTKAEWTVQMGQSLDANTATPTYTASNVSEMPVKYGQICTSGLACLSGGDRSLGDFLQVAIDNQGAALVSYVFDTSGNDSAGEDVGPEIISRQISGPSLIAGDTVAQGSGPGAPMGSVTDPTGDADYSANGSRTAGSTNLDLTGASLVNGPNNTLIAKIDVKSLKSLSASNAVGGPDASWLLRWTDVKPGTTGNGDIYYVGMDNNAGLTGGGSPSFFVGSTAGVPPPNPGEHTKYMTFPRSKKLSSSQASYDASTGVITLTIPRTDVGNPPDGTVLYSATAFSATSTTPQGPLTLFNLIDGSTPFELVVGPPGAVGNPPGNPGTPGGPHRTRCPLASGRLSGRTLGPLSLGLSRSSARHRFKHFSTRGRRYMDFFCLSPNGIRAGYPGPQLLRALGRKEGHRVQNRVVILLTANRYYTLDGIQPGTRLLNYSTAISFGHSYPVGLNQWFLFRFGSSRGIVKVRHGVVQEIGITDRRLTSTPKAIKLLLNGMP